MRIYVDQNYLIDFGTGKRPDDYERERIVREKMRTEKRHRFVISAWNMFETAKANDAAERASIVDFVDELNPLYVSNPTFIKRQELLQFLERRGQLPFPAGALQSINENPSRMWATYSGVVFIGESFASYVEYLSRSEANRKEIQEPATEAPGLIRNARKAAKDDSLAIDDALIDEEWLWPLLPERAPDGTWISEPVRKELLGYVLKDLPTLFQECPTILVDELRYRYSIFGERRIDKNHAIDTQHTLGPLSHCDFFLTSDKGLLDFIGFVNGKSNLKCRGIKRLYEVEQTL